MGGVLTAPMPLWALAPGPHHATGEGSIAQAKILLNMADPSANVRPIRPIKIRQFPENRIATNS
jgi:hypothetical protein